VRISPEEGGVGVGVVFFIDRSLGGPAVAAALKAKGATVERHDQHFPINAPDDVWIPEVGRRGWVVLTKDREIRYRGNEKAAVRNTGVKLFILRAKNIRTAEIAAAFAIALPAMLSP
jgi:predicted nuclease of predicted toxin-antitoxin system